MKKGREFKFLPFFIMVLFLVDGCAIIGRKKKNQLLSISTTNTVSGGGGENAVELARVETTKVMEIVIKQTHEGTFITWAVVKNAHDVSGYKIVISKPNGAVVRIHVTVEFRNGHNHVTKTVTNDLPLGKYSVEKDPEDADELIFVTSSLPVPENNVGRGADAKSNVRLTPADDGATKVDVLFAPEEALATEFGKHYYKITITTNGGALKAEGTCVYKKTEITNVYTQTGEGATNTHVKRECTSETSSGNMETILTKHQQPYSIVVVALDNKRAESALLE